MNASELKLLLDALNDRESNLCLEWETAQELKSTVLMMSLCDRLREVRNLADKLSRSLMDLQQS